MPPCTAGWSVFTRPDRRQERVQGFWKCEGGASSHDLTGDSRGYRRQEGVQGFWKCEGEASAHGLRGDRRVHDRLEEEDDSHSLACWLRFTPPICETQISDQLFGYRGFGNGRVELMMRMERRYFVISVLQGVMMGAEWTLI